MNIDTALLFILIVVWDLVRVWLTGWYVDYRQSKKEKSKLLEYSDEDEL